MIINYYNGIKVTMRQRVMKGNCGSNVVELVVVCSRTFKCLTVPPLK